MLVLSRRENQKVLFPNLGITVEIVGFKGSNVKLGIDAPPEIRILRSELVDDEPLNSNDFFGSGDVASESTMGLTEHHQRNNQLNAVALQVQIAQKLLKRGEHDQALVMLEQTLRKLRELDVNVAEETKNSFVQAPAAKWKVLLVEDDANERQLMATILNMCGFAVDVVEDGQAAIDYLQSNEKPDCVLMDMQMPRLSGPETIATIREQLEFTDVPIYGVSGLKQHEAKVPTGDRGVSGWFAKPVNADKLLAQIFEDIGANPEMTESANLN